MMVICPSSWALGKYHWGLFFFERLALRYSKANEAKPNNPIIEMIMIPNSELSILISRRKVSRQNKRSVPGLNASLQLLYSHTNIYTQKIQASKWQRRDGGFSRPFYQALRCTPTNNIIGRSRSSASAG